MHLTSCSRNACQVRWAERLPLPRVLPAPLPRGRPMAEICSQRLRCRSSNADESVYQSFDSEDDLDQELTDEFAKLTDPKKMQQVAAHLDLAWRIGKNRGKRLVCESCTGSGEDECHWCHGTGFLTVGDSLFCSTSGSCNCPVCKGKGYVKCEKCRGTGYRASWLNEQGFSP